SIRTFRRDAHRLCPQAPAFYGVQNLSPGFEVGGNIESLSRINAECDIDLSATGFCVAIHETRDRTIGKVIDNKFASTAGRLPHQRREEYRNAEAYLCSRRFLM